MLRASPWSKPYFKILDQRSNVHCLKQHREVPPDGIVRLLKSDLRTVSQARGSQRAGAENESFERARSIIATKIFDSRRDSGLGLRSIQAAAQGRNPAGAMRRPSCGRRDTVDEADPLCEGKTALRPRDEKRLFSPRWSRRFAQMPTASRRSCRSVRRSGEGRRPRERRRNRRPDRRSGGSRVRSGNDSSR
jgi:hypothetical protein